MNDAIIRGVGSLENTALIISELHGMRQPSNIGVVQPDVFDIDNQEVEELIVQIEASEFQNFSLSYYKTRAVCIYFLQNVIGRLQKQKLSSDLLIQQRCNT